MDTDLLYDEFRGRAVRRLNTSCVLSRHRRQDAGSIALMGCERLEICLRRKCSVVGWGTSLPTYLDACTSTGI